MHELFLPKMKTSVCLNTALWLLLITLMLTLLATCAGLSPEESGQTGALENQHATENRATLYQNGSSKKNCHHLWFIEKDGHCVEGKSARGLVHFDGGFNISIRSCYCMTYGVNKTGPFVGACFYNCYSKDTTFNNTLSYSHQNGYVSLPQSAEELENFMCSKWNRQGLLCGKCKNRYAPQVYSFDMRCIQCDPKDVYINILKYAFVAFVPLTVFLLILLCFRLNIMMAKLSVFIFLIQVLATSMMVRNILNTPLPPQFPPAIDTLIRTVLTCYGIWNLDFFRTLVPPICLNITTREALALDYIIALYPLAFLSVLYLLIRLHYRGCRIIVFLWRPFHICFARCFRVWDIRPSVVNTFAAFIFLAYSKLLCTQCDVFQPTFVYSVKGYTDGIVHSYFDASVSYTNRENITYTILGISVLFIFNILPILLLFLYPTRCGRKCLRSCGISGIFMQIFSDTFQGYYKDGTNGTRDCRFFPAVYLVARFALFCIYFVSPTALYFFLIPFFLVSLAILVMVLQPYKHRFRKWNQIDVIMILILALFFCALGLIQYALYLKRPSVLEISFYLSIIMGLLPLFYFVFIAIHCLIHHALAVILKYRRNYYALQ